jgi:hypothetical protein
MPMGCEAKSEQIRWSRDNVPWQTPEDLELQRKKAELVSLLKKVSQMETEFVTIRSELSAFEFKYHCTVGRRYAELDLLEANLAGAETFSNSAWGDRQAMPAISADEQKWLGAFRFLARQDAAVNVRPSKPLKRLYREVAKLIHPDLGLDEKDRLKRQSLMTQANEAYRSGDGHKLRAILLHWRSSPESVVGDGPGVELVRVIRRVDQVRRRIRLLVRKMEALRRSELYRLKTLIEENEHKGRDLMRQMAAILDERIARSRARLRGFAERQVDG